MPFRNKGHVHRDEKKESKLRAEVYDCPACGDPSQSENELCELCTDELWGEYDNGAD